MVILRTTSDAIQGNAIVLSPGKTGHSNKCIKYAIRENNSVFVKLQISI